MFSSVLQLGDELSDEEDPFAEVGITRACLIESSQDIGPIDRRRFR